MEERPLFPKPDEEEEDDDDQPKKKLPSLLELISKDERTKEQTSRDIARSLLDAKKEEASSDEPETNEADQVLEQQHPSELTPEEVVSINRSIAEDHLTSPVTEDQPQLPVTEFLGLVVDGVEPESAFGAIKIEHQLDDVEPAEEQPDDQALPSVETQSFDQPASIANTANDTAPRTSTQTRSESKPATPSKLATKLVGGIIHRRSSSKKANKSSTAETVKERRLEREVTTLEAKLTKQELTLQQLSQIKEVAIPKAESVVVERLQPGRSESRLNLTKPERAGHIGKVLVSSERAGAEQRKATVYNNPDQVKTMRRADLLDLSSNIKVEGASLKHMFENNLFSEAALRRLVEAKLRGQEMQPRLRREILDRQNYFEQDPRLRQRTTNSQASDDQLYDKMLASLDRTSLQENKPPIESSALNAQLSQPPAKATRLSVANAILGIIIALLVGLILFFTFH